MERASEAPKLLNFSQQPSIYSICRPQSPISPTFSSKSSFSSLDVNDQEALISSYSLCQNACLKQALTFLKL